MLTIILKIILCSSIFIAVYYLFLEREKMYKFNRFYLLSSLILSYVIPFISITVQLPKPENKSEIIFEEVAQQIIYTQPVQESFDWMNMMWIMYITVTLFFLIKSVLSIRALKKLQGKKQIYQNQKVIITKENLAPFSFWNTIYLGEEYIKNNVIDPRIFLHEKSHLDQKHSFDLILMDILKVFTWFNPALFLYKKAIITNHEFLADEAVLEKRYNIKDYQNLILDEIIISQNMALTHSLNFNNTKKRFIMMTAKKSKFILVKKTVGITAFIAATALFAERTYATSPALTTEKADSGMKNYKSSDFSNAAIDRNTESVKTSQPNNTSVVPYNYFEKITEENPGTVGIKKEYIPLSKPTQADNNEGKNTNISNNTNQNSTEAEYPGGKAALRKKIGLTFDTSSIQSKKGTISSTAYIHIDETGKATNVTATGDDEIFTKEFIRTATLISNEITWKPATKDGKAIASIYKLPATMTFQ